MANLKVVHLDSNVTRTKVKEEKEELLKGAFSKVNLHDTKGYKIYNESLYDSLVNAIESMNVTHLTQIDLFSVVEVANTMFLIQQIDDEIVKYGITQALETREGSTKLTVLQHIGQRNALLNVLDKQLSSLMLSPSQRHELLNNVQNNIGSIDFSDDDIKSIYDEIELNTLDGVQ